MATVVTAPDVGGGLSTSLGLTTAQATVALKQVGLDQLETTKRFRLVREGLAYCLSNHWIAPRAARG